MNEILAIDPKSPVYHCEFCHKDFQRESTLLAHLCEAKRRHRERDEVGVQIGLRSYLRFYEITQGSSRLKTWQDFVSSSYYRAFVKFGRHCQSIRAVNIPAFVDWLIAKNKKLDHWCQDQIYVEYLLQHVARENVMDALARSIESSMQWSEKTRNPSKDYLRFANDNTICHDITRGRLTGWAVYNSESGREFLSRVNQEQLSMIWPWIDTDTWNRIFRDYPADQAHAQEILTQAGW